MARLVIYREDVFQRELVKIKKKKRKEKGCFFGVAKKFQIM